MMKFLQSLTPIECIVSEETIFKYLFIFFICILVSMAANKNKSAAGIA